MSAIEDGGPAFPALDFVVPRDLHALGVRRLGEVRGMSLRQYAAIKLRVPDSGTVWLDDMIRASLRDELAARAMSGSLGGVPGSHLRPENIAGDSYAIAAALLRAREVKA